MLALPVPLVFSLPLALTSTEDKYSDPDTTLLLTLELHLQQLIIVLRVNAFNFHKGFKNLKSYDCRFQLR